MVEVVEARVLRFFGDLWRSACRPAVFRRSAVITLGLKILANFLIPFVVSNLGAMNSLPPRGT